ncbi:MAG TPA: Gfo/Idh/MocA family oxidoreductase [Kiritimatiellia bacterium]|mgnify:FL=1|nr:Gfo/Idh/MocA family oxidoreductase [Kiritimatiellia bacterium]
MNRRDFIKAGGSAFVIASASTLFGAGTPSKKMRLCVVGCARTKDHGNGFVVDPTGARGRGFQVMSRFAELKNCEITVLCDVDATALDDAASVVTKMTGRTPAKVKDFRDAVRRDDVDAVLVATPDHSHCYIGVEAMKAGKALFLEKPIGIAAGEAEILAEVQRKTGRVFQLGTQRRSSHATKQAINFIRSGQIGKPRWAKAWCLSDRPAIRNVKPVAVPAWMGADGWDLWQCCAPRRAYRSNIVHYNWRFFKGYGTGDLPNNGLHFVDIARWALDAEWPERVYAGGGKLFYEGEDFEWEDTHMLTVQFPDKKFLTWEGCSHSGAQPFMGKWTGTLVYCDDGLAFFGPRGESAIYDRKGKKVIKEWDAADTGDQEGDTRLSDPIRACDIWHVQRFTDCVLAGDLNTAQPIDSSLKSNLLTELGNVSLQIGDAVHVDSATGKLKDPKGPASKFWMPPYEPGWELKA